MDVGARVAEGRTETFSVGVEESDFNELPYARLVAEHAGTDHVETSVSFQLLKLIPTIIWHLEEPSDPIGACQFFAAQLASKSVKVVLGGDGGDELFAGFDRYKWLPSAGYYAKVPVNHRFYLGSETPAIKR